MPDLLETRSEGVAVLTLNRPEARNALSEDMLQGLLEALPRLAADPDLGAVIITGAGGAFCAGGDVKGFAASKGRRQSWTLAGICRPLAAPADGSLALAA